jgi:hypothetical protein
LLVVLLLLLLLLLLLQPLLFPSPLALFSPIPFRGSSSLACNVAVAAGAGTDCVGLVNSSLSLVVAVRNLVQNFAHPPTQCILPSRPSRPCISGFPHCQIVSFGAVCARVMCRLENANECAAHTRKANPSTSLTTRSNGKAVCCVTSRVPLSKKLENNVEQPPARRWRLRRRVATSQRTCRFRVAHRCHRNKINLPSNEARIRGRKGSRVSFAVPLDQQHTHSYSNAQC